MGRMISLHLYCLEAFSGSHISSLFRTKLEYQLVCAQVGSNNCLDRKRRVPHQGSKKQRLTCPKRQVLLCTPSYRCSRPQLDLLPYILTLCTLRLATPAVSQLPSLYLVSPFFPCPPYYLLSLFRTLLGPFLMHCRFPFHVFVPLQLLLPSLFHPFGMSSCRSHLWSAVMLCCSRKHFLWPSL